jgi:mannose-6-phosphate isomerase-like protein (cupin superfamily)
MSDVTISRQAAEERLIKRSDYVSCSVAFIDCKTPGSHLKENYSLIGPGVTSSADQVINLREPHGFNIGAAAMPNGITNNLHIHFTAEVFLCFKGEWKFRWGRNGDDGEIVGRAGDIVSVPTWIFRGFTNVGPDDGWIFTALGGDDTGGIIWHPSIISGAAQYGLYLSKDNMLIDTEKGAPRPSADQLINPMPAEEIAKLRRYSVEEMRQRVVTREERDWSADALLDSCLEGHRSEIAPVIGYGISQDRNHAPKITNPHGFSIEWLRVPAGQSVSSFRIGEKQVLMSYSGSASVVLNEPGSEVTLELNAWDTLSVPADVWRSIRNTSDVDTEIVVITAGEGRKTPEWRQDTLDAVLRAGRGVDKSGLIAPAYLIPSYAMGKR